MAQDVKQFEKAVRAMAATCTDTTLRAQLLANVAKLPTLASQLKILSTVRAASPGDHENDKMVRSHGVAAPNAPKKKTNPSGRRIAS